MARIPTLRTERLLLRPWRDGDLEPFARLNADPVVMVHFPTTLERKESNALVARMRKHFDDHGYGRWAVEVPYVAPFVGCIGLFRPTFDAHFTPCVEVSWRLAREHWGHGYAAEGARAALRFAFEQLGLDEVVAFTAARNQASLRVMERLGMHHTARDDFDHPHLPLGHPLRRHLLYRLPRVAWEARPSYPRATGS
jgi:RimJ/RimL family protein N-acetyltransferase